MDSDKPHAYVDRRRAHKPFLIDPAEEGTKPQGVDSTWWARWLGLAQMFFPQRFRGLPPLFYIPALAGIFWGIAFLFFRISGLPVPTGMELEPAPPLPNAVLDVVVILMAAAGVVQGVGTLYRKRWGLTAAYAWFALGTAFCWLALGSVDEPHPMAAVGVFLDTAVLLCFIVYYHNRRAWFGGKTRR